MERKKYTLVLLFMLCILASYFNSGYAQENHKSLIYEAYSRGKMDKWLKVMQGFEVDYYHNKSTEQAFELINYYYGYTGWLISVDEFDLAEDYIEKSEVILDELYKIDNNSATVLAYKGAFIAYEIGISSYKAIYLGRTSMRNIEKALELDENNIQAHIEMGNAMYYCPAAFGGDKKLAIEHYKKAAYLMETAGRVSDNWMYLNVMTVLGMAYEETEQIQNAKLCYEKVLSVKPNFMWVGEELYPDMLKRHNL